VQNLHHTWQNILGDHSRCVHVATVVINLASGEENSFRVVWVVIYWWSVAEISADCVTTFRRTANRGNFSWLGGQVSCAVYLFLTNGILISQLGMCLHSTAQYTSTPEPCMIYEAAYLFCIVVDSSETSAQCKFLLVKIMLIGPLKLYNNILFEAQVTQHCLQ